MKEQHHKNPFKAPEGYFEGFGARLNEKLAETMGDLPIEDGFTVPDGYFDSVEERILQKAKGKDSKVIPLHPFKKYYYAAAGVAAVLLVYFGLNLNTNTPITFENLANAEIEAYFDSNELALSTNEIAEVLPIDELEISDILESRFDEEYVMDYLDNNIEDFEALNLEDNE